MNKEEELSSLNELLLIENVKDGEKRCTMGVVIDCSATYQTNNNRYMKKIKIIDESLNVDKASFTFKYCFCTVMFYAERPEELPSPNCLGDIIYLRRYLKI